MKKALKITGIIVLILLAIVLYKSRTLSNYYNYYNNMVQTNLNICIDTYFDGELNNRNLSVCESLSKCIAKKLTQNVVIVSYGWGYRYNSYTPNHEFVVDNAFDTCRIKLHEKL